MLTFYQWFLFYLSCPFYYLLYFSCIFNKSVKQKRRYNNYSKSSHGIELCVCYIITTHGFDVILVSISHVFLVFHIFPSVEFQPVNVCWLKTSRESLFQQANTCSKVEIPQDQFIEYCV